MAYKEILGFTAVAIALISYIPYFRDIFENRTKPHPFSWFIWGLLTGIAFIGQISDKAGSGAWVTGFTALACFSISFFGFTKGKKNIVFIDWFGLLGTGIALFFWLITKGPLISVILIALIDAIGFFPTFRKSFIKPQEETLVTYTLSGLKFLVALFALENISLVTTIYPASLVLMNLLFVAMLIIRKKQLNL